MEFLVELKRCHDGAQLPTQAVGNVGFDLYAAGRTNVLPGATALVPTGWMLASSPELMGVPHALLTLLKIEGRSGMALAGVWPVGGIVDPSYRGEIKVILYNSTPQVYTVEKGARVAQFVAYPVIADTRSPFDHVEFREVKGTTPSERGTDGFGSSGE